MVRLIKKAKKLTWGQELTVKVPHAVTTLTNTEGLRFLSSSQQAQDQGFLCENPWVTRLRGSTHKDSRAHIVQQWKLLLMRGCPESGLCSDHDH